MSLAMRECRRCGHAVFPPRPLCPSCGAWDWKERLVERGVVEAVTARESGQLASVRTEAGPVVTAVAAGGALAVGMEVALESRVGVGVSGGGVQARVRPHASRPAAQEDV
jgi:uncharacterized OB-fold protein